MRTEQPGWFDKKENRTLFFRTFYAGLAILLVLDLFVEKHPFFGFDGVLSFSAAYGFLSIVVLVLIARSLRLLMIKNEDYYDE